MGRFSHEAAAVDPATGVVYLTEDDKSSLRGAHELPLSLRAQRHGTARSAPRRGAAGGAGRRPAPGRLAGSASSPSRRTATPSAAAAARFAPPRRLHVRGRRALVRRHLGRRGRSLGQIFRYTPAQERLELVLESRDAARLDQPDNLTMTPWGDLFAAEDGKGENRLMGITPDGQTYVFAASHRRRARRAVLLARRADALPERLRQGSDAGDLGAVPGRPDS